MGPYRPQHYNQRWSLLWTFYCTAMLFLFRMGMSLWQTWSKEIYVKFIWQTEQTEWEIIFSCIYVDYIVKHMKVRLVGVCQFQARDVNGTNIRWVFYVTVFHLECIRQTNVYNKGINLQSNNFKLYQLLLFSDYHSNGQVSFFMKRRNIQCCITAHKQVIGSFIIQ